MAAAEHGEHSYAGAARGGACGADGRGSAGGGLLLRSDAVDVDPGGDKGQLVGSKDPGAESAHLATPPQDLSILVNQLYSQIKRELTIERERRGGVY